MYNREKRMKASCIQVPRKSGETAIALARKLQLLDKELELQRDEESLYIPITRQLTIEENEVFKKHISKFEICIREFSVREKRVKSYMNLLENELPAHLFTRLPRAIDFIGDIAIIEVPSELNEYRTMIGEAILKTYKKVHTVLAKASAVSGTYRVRSYEVIAGENKTETIHKEFGCRYHVDVARAYFSPRLSTEHQRVAQLVREGETVIDMFAGVGPFSILIAKKRSDVKVYAIDVNPDAVALLEENIRLNRVDAKVYPILGDAREIIDKKLAGIGDRVIMNLPGKALDFVEAACKALKKEGGIIHFYGFATASSIKELEAEFKKKVEETGRKLEKILHLRPVRETAPYEWQIVLDAQVV